nr:hypothetical protein [Tanacetum cinerariifolium]
MTPDQTNNKNQVAARVANTDWPTASASVFANQMNQWEWCGGGGEGWKVGELVGKRLAGKTGRSATVHAILNGEDKIFGIFALLVPQVNEDYHEKRIEEEQTVKAQSWKFPVCYDDDDDEEGYNSLNDNIISELPSYSAVTPNEPVDSLIMEDKHLDTIPATESDEFINSCVENLVPNPSESEGKNGCDVPAGFTTFSNVLFDADYDFDSSDDQSLSVEDIDSLFDEFAGELTLLKSFPPGIDETDCHPEKEIIFAKRLLYDNSSPRPPEKIVSDNSIADIESFSPSPILNKDSDSHMEEIDLYLNPNDPMPPGIKDDDYDSERDMPILEELLDNYSLSLPAKESYHFDIPSPYRPPAKPPDGITGTLNIKIMGDVSDQKPSVECPMIINGKNIPLLNVLLFHFYPP